MAEASFLYSFELLLFAKDQEFVLFPQVLFPEVESNEIVKTRDNIVLFLSSFIE